MKMKLKQMHKRLNVTHPTHYNQESYLSTYFTTLCSSNLEERYMKIYSSILKSHQTGMIIITLKVVFVGGQKNNFLRIISASMNTHAVTMTLYQTSAYSHTTARVRDPSHTLLNFITNTTCYGITCRILKQDSIKILNCIKFMIFEYYLKD
jgi:hypothetical protein